MRHTLSTRALPACWKKSLAISLLFLFVAQKGIAAPPPPPEGGFTVAVMPDTQNYTDVASRHDIFNSQTQWIRDHREEYNIKYVLHLGDIVQVNAHTDEWDVAKTAFSLLDTEDGLPIVPYALAVGNHDMGSTGIADTRASHFNDPAYFGLGSVYANQPTIGGFFEPGRTDNSWHTFSAGAHDYLVLSLEFGPRDAVVAWANWVLREHPDHRTILITHAYLFSSSARYNERIGGQAWIPDNYGIATTAGEAGINDGQDLWEKLVWPNDNVVLVINGHVLHDGTGQLTSVSRQGRVVHQLLANYQMIENGGDGFMRLLEFMPDGETVKVYAFSTYTGEENAARDHQFTLGLPADSIAPDPVAQVLEDAPVLYYRLENAEGPFIPNQGTAGHDFSARYTGSGEDPSLYDGNSELTGLLPSSFGEAFAIALWARPTDINGGEVVVRTDNATLGIGVEPATGTFHWVFGAPGSDTETAQLADRRRAIVAGNWYQLVVSSDGEQWRLYVDGELVDESLDGQPFGGALHAGIGLIGELAELAAFDRALTTGEVTAQRLAAFNRLIAGNLTVTGPALPDSNTVDDVKVVQQNFPGLSVTQRNRGDYQIFLGGARPVDPNRAYTGGLPALAGDGALLSVPRQALRDGAAGSVETGWNSFGDGVLSLATSQVATGSEMNLNTAVVWFPFSAGWKAGHVNSGGQLIEGRLPPRDRIEHLGAGRYHVALGLRGNERGMLFAVGGSNANRIVQAMPQHGHREWAVQVRENAFGYEVQDDFSFAFIPFQAKGLIGGLYDGAADTHEVRRGEFTLERTAPGTYRLMIPDESPESGVLLLTIADVDTPVFAGYAPENEGAFVIHTRDITTLAPQDARFAWTFVSFDTPLSPL